MHNPLPIILLIQDISYKDHMNIAVMCTNVPLKGEPEKKKRIQIYSSTSFFTWAKKTITIPDEGVTGTTGADAEILKRSGALCRPPQLADEENFRF